MKRFLKVLALTLFLSLPSFAQNALVSSVVLPEPANVLNWAQNNGNTGCLYRVGALSATGTGASFSPLLTIYSDRLQANVISQASGIACPTSGIISFFASPGTYIIQYQFLTPSSPANAGGPGSQFFNQIFDTGGAQAFLAYQGTTSVGITSTSFVSLIAAASDGLVPANTLNVQGKKLRIHFDGVYTNAAASLLNAEVEICTVSGCGSGTVVAPAGCAIVSTNQANTVTNGQFSGDCTLTTSSTLGSSGTVMAKGLYCFQLGAAVTAASSCFNDQATAVSSAFDETVNEFVNVAFKFSTGNAGNSAILHDLTVTLEN